MGAQAERKEWGARAPERHESGEDGADGEEVVRCRYAGTKRRETAERRLRGRAEEAEMR